MRGAGRSEINVPASPSYHVLVSSDDARVSSLIVIIASGAFTVPSFDDNVCSKLEISTDVRTNGSYLVCQ